MLQLWFKDNQIYSFQQEAYMKRCNAIKGIAYGGDVGPGDPEMMTLKAERLNKENSVFSLPGKEPRDTVAYRIAVAAEKHP